MRTLLRGRRVKVKFEAMSDVDAARVVASVSSYDVNK